MILNKKTAMFGLCRVLRKQSGGLFLASRHSEASKGANASFKTNRAAMFGLDARIALAIFGALSVISSAALYSAIQKAKATAIMMQYEEVGKAVESYYLDVGSIPMTLNKTGFAINANSDIGYLLQSSAPGWNGPYLPYKYVSRYSIEINGYSTWLFLHGDRTGVTELDSSMSCATTSGVRPCFLYLQIRDTEFSSVAEAIDMFNLLDEHVDGGDGFHLGKVHAIQAGNSTASLDPSGAGVSIYYQLIPCEVGLCY